MLLAVKTDYSISECLEAISKVHYHSFRVVGGVVVGRTMGLGLDLRSETPPQILTNISKAVQEKKEIALTDAIELANMSTAQWESLPYNFSIPIPQAQALAVKKNQHLLRLYGSLSEGERAIALGIKGLRLNALKSDQKKYFDRLACVGYPRVPPKGVAANVSGLYILRNRIDDNTIQLSLCLVPADPTETRDYHLPIHEAEGELKFSP